jgi:hypothetical protein
MKQNIFPTNDKIIATTLDGLILAREEFTTLTGSDDWGEWINYPEYMIGSCIIRHTKYTLQNIRIWPEIAPKEISIAKKIRKGRIDIVIDDIFDNPKVILEVKANVGLVKDFDSKKGVKKDIQRICTILESPKNSESLQLGLFAFIANRNDTSLNATLLVIEKKSRNVAESYGFTLKSFSRKIEHNDKKWDAHAVVYAITKG